MNSITLGGWLGIKYDQGIMSYGGPEAHREEGDSGFLQGKLSASHGLGSGQARVPS